MANDILEGAETHFPFNTGDPIKLSKFSDKTAKSLKETKLNLVGARNRIENLIKGDHSKHFNTVDMATFKIVLESIQSGIDYLEFADDAMTNFQRKYDID